MSCIFSCFRSKDVSSSSSSTLKHSNPEDTVNRNRIRSPLSSLFIAEENPEENACAGSKVNGSELQDLEVNELKNQAKFHKACGTIPETPAEIRKVAEEKNGVSSQKGEVESLKLRSWLTYTSVEKLDCENFNKNCEEWLDGAGSEEHSPKSCITLERNTERVTPNSNEGDMVLNAESAGSSSTHDYYTADSSISSSIKGPRTPNKNKSVRFDCQMDTYSASSKSYSSEVPAPKTLNVSGSAGNFINAKPSPNITTQYMSHSVDGGLLQRKVLDDRDSFPDQLDHHGRDPFGKAGESVELKSGKTSTGKDLIPEASMSPLPGAESNNLDGSKSSVVKNRHRVRNPGDRPIIGLVATHWNDNETSPVVSKWWDGNGIPNSTNKYQEDQKVCWHATSFEERLEKALSEETLISQRKQSTGKPPDNSMETEESDTAMSRLQPSTHFKPVVSF